MTTSRQHTLTASELAEALSHPLLAMLDESGRSLIAQRARRAWFRPRRPIFRAGDAPATVAFVLSGSVRVHHRSAAGHERLAGILAAPTVVGVDEVLAHEPTDSVQSIDATTTIQVPAELFRWMVENQPDFAIALCKHQARMARVRAVTERSCHFDALSTRVARLLMRYAEIVGQSTQDGIRLTQPLSQESLARDLGVSRKSLNRALRPLRESGVLAKREARYVICDQTALAGLV